MHVRRWLSSFIFFLIIDLSSLIIVQAAAIVESQALLKFKHSLSNTTRLRNWNPSTHPCSGWFGIRCLANNRTVWTLQLQGMGLTGRIDVSALLPLPRLRSISLMNNHFHGTIPPFNTLGALKSIFISNNKFSGHIPDDAFAGMRFLKKVHMANNDFTGTIPSSLTYLSMLLELRMEGNKFRGRIPNFHRKQQLFLRSFNVSQNHLSGPIPESLRRMDVTSFRGNENLCGLPLDPCVSSKSKMKHSWKIATVVIVACIAIGAIVIVISILIIIHSRRSRGKENDLQMNSSSVHSPASSRSSLSTDLKTTTRLPEAAAAAAAASEQHEGEEEDDDLCFVSSNINEMRFDLQQLLRAPSEVLVDVVGGNFGSNSYKASIHVTGELQGNCRCLVVKRYNKQLMGTISREDFEEHMRKLGKLNHPNVLPLTAYYYRKDEKLLLYEFIPNTCSLATYLHGTKNLQGVLEWQSRLKIIKGVCRGLQYLYSEFPELVTPHGHLKSSNVLLQQRHDNMELMEPLLTDYALSAVTSPDYIHQIMVAYRSPEASSTHHHVSTKSDIWCLGTLILELLTGKLPALVYIHYQSSDEEEVDLATWVASTNIETVLDKEILKATKLGYKSQIMKLLEIGLSCCEKEVHRRLSIAQAVHKVEELTDHEQ